jgi:hypothetical protein
MTDEKTNSNRCKGSTFFGREFFHVGIPAQALTNQPMERIPMSAPTPESQSAPGGALIVLVHPAR